MSGQDLLDRFLSNSTPARVRRHWRAIVAGAALALSSPAQAAAPRDWPCVQAYVPGISEGAIWTGPEITPALRRDWSKDPELKRLVEQAASRRSSVEDAAAAIRAFAERLPPDRRKQDLTKLFAGLLETIDAERNAILEGIGRYAKRQEALAKRIAERSGELSRQPTGNDPAAQAIAAGLEEQIYWDSRVFEDRRRMLPYVCELPTVLEQRLFALGREIMAMLPPS
jgi:hypothetical protein